MCEIWIWFDVLWYFSLDFMFIVRLLLLISRFHTYYKKKKIYIDIHWKKKKKKIKTFTKVIITASCIHKWNSMYLCVYFFLFYICYLLLLMSFCVFYYFFFFFSILPRTTFHIRFSLFKANKMKKKKLKTNDFVSQSAFLYVVFHLLKTSMWWYIYM